MQSKYEKVILFVSMVIFLCIISPVSVSLSFTSVPISLGSLGIMIVAMLMGWKQAAAITGVYIVLGCLGLPVFAGWSGGISSVGYSNVGYLIGYIVMALVIGFIVDKHQFSLWAYFVSGVVGTVILYIIGCRFLSKSLETTFSHAVVYGAVPFFLFDAAKIIFSSVLCFLIRSHIKLFIKLP